MKRSALLTVTALSALPLVLHAAPHEDRFTLRVAAINLDAENTLQGSTVIDDRLLNFDEDFRLGGKEWEPRVDLVFRMGERHRLIADYFRYSKVRRDALEETVQYGDEAVPAGSALRTDISYRVGSVVYDFAAVNNPDFQLGLQIGGEYARVDGVIDADLGKLYKGRAVDEKADGIAPVLGLRLSITPGDRWLINLQGQYLDTDWGSFDNYDGSLSRANAIVEYRFTERFGLFAGYDWFRLDVDQIGREGLIGLKQEFKGPMAGLSMAF